MRTLTAAVLLLSAVCAFGDTAERTLDGSASTLAFSRDGKLLAAGDMKGTLRVWDVAGGTAARTITAKSWIRGVAFSPDAKQLAYATSDDLIVLFDLENGREVRTWKGGNAVAFSPDGSLLAFGDKGASGTVKIWTASEPKERVLRGHVNPITCLTFDSEGKRLASGGNDNTARIWDIGTSKEVQRFHGGQGLWVDGVRFSPAGDKLVYGALITEAAQGAMFNVKGGRIVVRNAATGEEIRSIDAHTQPVDMLAFSPDGKRLASCGDDKVKLWNAETGELERTLDADAMDLAFSPDGKWLACATKTAVRLIPLE